MRQIIDPYAREVFADDFLKDRTVKGTFESPEHLTKTGVFIPESLKRKKLFDQRAFISRETSAEELERQRKLIECYCRLHGCKDEFELMEERERASEQAQKIYQKYKEYYHISIR